MKTNSYAKKLVVIGLMIALNIILVRFLSIKTPMVRISFGFLPIAIVGILYGPIWGGVAGAVSDIIGITLMPIGTPFFGFTLTAFLAGVFYGYFLHNKEISYKNVILAVLPVIIICDLLLNTYWLQLLYGKAFVAMLPLRLLKIAVLAPLQVFTIHLVWNRIVAKTRILQG